SDRRRESLLSRLLSARAELLELGTPIALAHRRRDRSLERRRSIGAANLAMRIKSCGLCLKVCSRGAATTQVQPTLSWQGSRKDAVRCSVSGPPRLPVQPSWRRTCPATATLC